MARSNRSQTQIIPPFPKNIDRDYFGAWLSGFTDGEGCFRLCADKRTNSKHPSLTGEFTIGQRCDDVKTLVLIQSYLQCGLIYIDPRHYTKYTSHPKACLRIKNPSELMEKVIPQFQKFPLLAKKKNDFAIWSEGVKMLYAIFLKPFQSGGDRRGRIPKWTDEEKEKYLTLVKALKDQRQFDESHRVQAFTLR